MTTNEFLATVLPSDGWYCIAWKPKSQVGTQSAPRHKWLDTLEETADELARLSAKGCDTYMAMGAFADPDPETGGRVQSNVRLLRSFYMDVDLKGGVYPTKRAIAEVVLTFSQTHSLPVPMLVDTGGGIHIYWPLDEDITPEQWLPVASALKLAAKQAGIAADHGVTADSARVLRPVGCMSIKRNVMVRQAVAGDGPQPLSRIAAALAAFVRQPSVSDANAALMGGVSYAPVDAEAVADRCPAVAMMRDTKGDLPQPQWYSALGVVAFCENGDEVAHSWSEGHPKYSPRETEQKLEQARQFKPTTCLKMSDAFEDVCAGCPHWGKIVSPISLGVQRMLPADAAIDAPVAPAGEVEEDDDGTEVTVSKESGFPEPPYPYTIKTCPHSRRLSLYYAPRGAEPVKVSQMVFWAEQRVDALETAAGEMQLTVVAMPTPTTRRSFRLPLGKMGGNGLIPFLAQQEIMPNSPKSKPLLEDYLSKWVDKLRMEGSRETKQHTKFGWSDDCFVIGDTLITPTGTEKAVVAGMASSRADHFGVSGSLDVWKNICDRAYNHPGQEPFQFCVLAAFAAPLMALWQEFGGITVHAYSEASGVGKTTAQRMGLAAFGHWGKLELAESQVTENSLKELLGVHGNLPLVLDELTHMSATEVGKLLMSISKGTGRQRLRPTGEWIPNLNNWQTIMLCSSNNKLAEKAMSSRGHSAAELARLFEFEVKCKSPLTLQEANQLFPAAMENYGHPGRAFLAYLVQQREAVKQMMFDLRQRMNAEWEVTQSERYWVALCASVMTALIVCRHLDLLRFDTAVMYKWMKVRVVESRSVAASGAASPETLFAEFMAEMAQNIIVTDIEGSMLNRQPAQILNQPKAPFAGRAILGSMQHGVNAKPRLLVCERSIRDYAVRRGATYSYIVEGLRGAGLVVGQLAFPIGAGTPYAPTAGVQKVVEVDLGRLGMPVGMHTVAMAAPTTAKQGVAGP